MQLKEEPNIDACFKYECVKTIFKDMLKWQCAIKICLEIDPTFDASIPKTKKTTKRNFGMEDLQQHWLTLTEHNHSNIIFKFWYVYTCFRLDLINMYLINRHNFVSTNKINETAQLILTFTIDNEQYFIHKQDSFSDKAIISIHLFFFYNFSS